MLRTSVCIAAVILAVGLSAPAFAGQPLSQATDFSSQNKNKKAVAAAKPAGGQRITRTVTTTRVTTRAGGGQTFKGKTVTTTTRKGNVNTNAKVNTGKPANVETGQHINVNPQNLRINNPQGVNRAGTIAGPGGDTVKFQADQPRSRRGQASGPCRADTHRRAAASSSGRNLEQRPEDVVRAGKWKVFVPVTALGVVTLGGAYYYPQDYPDGVASLLRGVTPDGCR